MLKILFLELMDDYSVLDVLFKYLKWVPPISGKTDYSGKRFGLSERAVYSPQLSQPQC